jgi:RNA polymerase sigma-70 factor (ECF subfamily)
VTAIAPESSDAFLVSQSKLGNHSAFGQLVTRNWKRVYWRVYRYLHSHSDTEEVTQETFIRAYRGLPGFRGEAAFSTWLYSIAFRLALNRRRYLARQKRSQEVSLSAPVGPDGTLTVGDLLATDDESPMDASEREELAKNIAAAMARIDAKQREALVLRNARHLSYEAIAARLGVALGTVKSRIARGREALRRQLPPDYIKRPPPQALPDAEQPFPDSKD